MGFFSKRRATNVLMVMSAHPGYARQFTAADAQELVAQGANVNALMQEGYSPLAHVSVWGNTGVARVLLANGADPNGNALRRQIPLAIAAQNGHEELLRALLAAGADVNAQDHRSGQTALHCGVIPAAAQCTDVVEILVAHGANPRIRDREGRTPLGAFAHHASVLTGMPPFLNETWADCHRRDRELNDELARLTGLLGAL